MDDAHTSELSGALQSEAELEPELCGERSIVLRAIIMNKEIIIVLTCLVAYSI
jgi:hypothetical protein